MKKLKKKQVLFSFILPGYTLHNGNPLPWSLCLNKGGREESYLAGAKVGRVHRMEGKEEEGGCVGTLHRNVQDRSMGAKDKPLLNLMLPLDRGQRLLETMYSAPNGFLLLVTSPCHLGALSLYTEGWAPDSWWAVVLWGKKASSAEHG